MERGRIYYFSGTGNSYYCAKKLGEKLGLKTEKIRKETDAVGEVEYLGLVFPIYALGPPNIVREFIKKMESIEASYVFVVFTYGGVYGKALEYTRSLLEKEGLKLSYGAGVRYPDNYIIAFKVPDEKKQMKLLSEADKKLVRVIKELKGKKQGLEKDKIPQRYIPNFVYKYSAKHFRSMGKNLKADDRCISCGLCERECPTKNIVLAGKKIVFGVRCELCLRCVHVCPVKSINYKNRTQDKKRYLNPKVYMVKK